MAMALLFLNLSTILTDFGIGQAVIQFRALTREHVRTSYTLSLLMAIAVGATCWLFSPAIATWFGESQLEWILRAVAASFLVRAFATTAEALLQRELRFRELAIADVAGYVLGYALPSIILAWQGFGVWSLVAGVVGQAIVRTTVVLMFRRHSIIPLLRRSAVTDLWFNGLGFFLARITTFVATEGDNLVVGKALGAATLGIYSRAYQLLMMPVNLLGMSVDRVLFPAMSEAQDDPRRLGRAFGRSTAAIGIALGPVSAFCIVAAPELVLVLLGPQWTAVVAPFQILSAIMVLRASYKVSESVLRAVGAVFQRAGWQLVYAIATLLGAWFGSRMGVAGVAAGVALAVLLNALLMARVALPRAGMAWIEYWRINIAWVRVSSLVALVSYAVAYAGRSVGAHALVVVITSALASATLVATLIRIRPATIGADALWAFAYAVGRLPRRIGSPLERLLCLA